MRKNSRAYSFFNGRFFWWQAEQRELTINRDKAVEIRATCAEAKRIAPVVFVVLRFGGSFDLNGADAIVG